MRVLLIVLNISFNDIIFVYLRIPGLKVSFFGFSLELDGLLADAIFEVPQQLFTQLLTISGDVTPVLLLDLRHHVNIPRGCVKIVNQFHFLDFKADLFVVLKCLA